MSPQQLGWPFTRPGQQQQQLPLHREHAAQQQGQGQEEASADQGCPSDSGAADGRYLVQQVEENRIVDVV
jgi:hypothetical protein